MNLTTTINHIARRQLGLSWMEYGACDLIYKLSHTSGWCNMSRQRMADEMGLSKTAVVLMVNRLVEKGVVVRNNQGNTRVSNLWHDTVIWANDAKESFFSGKEALPIIGKESLPEKTKSVKKVNRSGKESLPEIGKESLPYTKNSYPKNNTSEEEDTANFLKPGEAANPIPKISPSLTSENTAKGPAAKMPDYEAEAVRYIHAKICTTSRAQKDSWAMKYGSSLTAAGISPEQSIRECAEYIRLNDKILSYLTGQTLLNEIDSLPAIRFISFFQNKWLPNIKPSRVVHLQNPNVLPQSTLYKYMN